MTVWLRCLCEFGFHIDTSTPFLFMLRPRSGANQWIVDQRFKLTPDVIPTEFTDGFGNLCQRVLATPGTLEVHCSAIVQTADGSDENPAAEFVEVQKLPPETIAFLFPSRYCESDRMGPLAMELTSGFQPGYSQAAAIVTWIRDTIAYRPGMSNVPVSAVETKDRGYGVCRDLAQLGIALCRSLSIPSRMVVGYLHGLQPMDLHAWFECFVGGRWYTMDPTQPNLNGGRVAIAYGRDAADVAVFTQFGDLVVPLRQLVEVERIDPPHDAAF